MFKTIIKSIILMTSISLLGSHVQAMEATDVPENKHTKLGLYFNSTEAASFMENNGEYALFLDVRDPHELQTTGMASSVDYNLPFNYININKWDSEKSRFKFETNPNFARDVNKRFKAKGLSGHDAIVIICTSGTRAAKTVNFLAETGLKNIYTVVDGFDGWKRNNLKWSRKLDRSKMYGKVTSSK
ncbi:MAG: rhodanese-like domain-containing protein [Gammaproteobacteria bacterium]